MKKITLLLGTALTVIFLVACGTSNENTANEVDESTTHNATNQAENEKNMNNVADEPNNNQKENNTTDDSNQNQAENNSSERSMMDKMEEIDIEEIEVKVEYGDQREYEMEIEKDSKSDEGYEATLDDDLNDEYLKGQEAFDKLYPLVKKLDIDADTSKEDAINQVLKAFDLSADYSEIEIEINLWDQNQKIEFEEEK